MTTLPFNKFTDVLAYCEEHHCSVGQAALDYELSRNPDTNAEAVRAKSLQLIQQMRATIESGLFCEEKSMSGLSGGMSKQLMDFMSSQQAFLSPMTHKMMAYAISTLEENSRMHRIVACPTAGGSGVVPAVLMALAQEKNLTDDQLVDALLAGGLVGELVSRRMFLSGAAGGCQAEVGVATGMASCGGTQALGGTPEQAFHATALAFQNLMGLVCDPVAGLVEVPCVMRNAIGAMHAAGSITMALAGIKSFIPVDEVVESMAKVGQMMSPKLKESAEGGLADTPTARQFTQSFQQRNT